jgi:hypothetical protein
VVTATTVLERAAVQAYPDDRSLEDAIATSTGDLRKAWLLKSHLVGFFVVESEVNRKCLGASVDPSCYGSITSPGESIQNSIDDVTVILQSFVGDSGV